MRNRSPRHARMPWKPMLRLGDRVVLNYGMSGAVAGFEEDGRVRILRDDKVVAPYRPDQFRTLPH